MMNRIVDFNPADEDVLVSRLLIRVHKAIDRDFPNAEEPSRQFSRTLFSDGASDQTAVVALPSQEEIQRAEEKGLSRETQSIVRGQTKPSARSVKTVTIWRKLFYLLVLIVLLIAGFFGLVYYTA